MTQSIIMGYSVTSRMMLSRALALLKSEHVPPKPEVVKIVASTGEETAGSPFVALGAVEKTPTFPLTSPNSRQIPDLPPIIFVSRYHHRSGGEEALATNACRGRRT